MKNLTRREAVKTGAAIAAVGATATLSLSSVAEAGTQDAELLTRLAEWYRANAIFDLERLAGAS